MNCDGALAGEGVHGLRGLILSNVKIANYPQLKVLQEGSRIRIVGKISEIGVSAPTKITDAKLFFLPPSQKESVWGGCVSTPPNNGG
jgi:hypothetical protein